VICCLHNIVELPSERSVWQERENIVIQNVIVFLKVVHVNFFFGCAKLVGFKPQIFFQGLGVFIVVDLDSHVLLERQDE